MNDPIPVHRVPGRSLSILVHADTKVGKSTFGNTAPAPRLLLDAEAASRFLPGRQIVWDPMTEYPPEYDGTWDTCVVKVKEYMTIVKVYEWLNSGQHSFLSVIVDSISEIQTQCKAQIQGEGQMKIQMWGELLTKLEKLIRQFRDLTEHRTHPLEAIVITAMTQLKDGKYRPYVQGQLQVKMPYFLDVIGFMYVDQIQGPDPTKPPTRMRRMLVVPHVQFEAGERVQGRLNGDVVDNPDVSVMLDMIFGPKPEPVTNTKGNVNV